MKETRQMLTRSICALLTVCLTLSLFAPVTASAEETDFQTTTKTSTSADFSSAMGEYYEARTPANEKNTLYVKGQVQKGVKTLRISLTNLSNKSNYLNVFVQPDNNGRFEVKINTASGNNTTPTAVTGKVYSASDKAWDARPGYRAVETMPKGMYLLRIATAKTTADADVCNGAKWYNGTLGGEHGFVWNTAMLYVSGSGNNPKLIEFTDIINRSKTVQQTGSVYNSRYTDVYLKDMSYVLKDGSFRDKPMNADRVAYIKKVANEVTSGASSDAERLMMIYKYVAGNFYYDHYAYDLYVETGINIQCVNPYDNLYNMRNKVKSTNSTSDGKVATVCDGYAAMIVALCRSLDIPARSVYGCTNDTSDGLTSRVDTSKKNHWWAEVYINGRWVIVDAERGSLNSWNRNELSTSGKDSRYSDSKYKDAKYWDYQGYSVSGLDMSLASRATNFMLTGVQDSTGGKPYVEGISATIDDASGKPLLTWTEMSGTGKYYIYRGTTESSIEYYSSSKTNSFIDTQAVAGTTYYYWVTPVSSTEGSKSNMVSVKCQSPANSSTAPAAPVLKITTSSGKPQIYWEPVSGAVKYWIYRCTDGKSYSFYDSTTRTSYINSSTELGKTYYYKVKAVNADGMASEQSGAKSIQRKPSAPRIVINRSKGKPKISWSAVDGAVKYWIYRSTDGVNYKYYDSTKNTVYTNNSTTTGTQYYYKVKAVAIVNGTNVASGYSNSKGLVASTPAPNVSISTSNGKPKLSWSSVSGASKYWIYRSTDGVNFSYYDSTTRLSYTNSGAKAGNKYYYKLKAIAVINGKNVASGYSNTVSVKAK